MHSPHWQTAGYYKDWLSGRTPSRTSGISDNKLMCVCAIYPCSCWWSYADSMLLYTASLFVFKWILTIAGKIMRSVAVPSTRLGQFRFSTWGRSPARQCPIAKWRLAILFGVRLRMQFVSNLVSTDQLTDSSDWYHFVKLTTAQLAYELCDVHWPLFTLYFKMVHFRSIPFSLERQFTGNHWGEDTCQGEWMANC